MQGLQDTADSPAPYDFHQFLQNLEGQGKTSEGFGDLTFRGTRHLKPVSKASRHSFFIESKRKHQEYCNFVNPPAITQDV